MKSEIFKGGVEQSCLISALVDIFSFFGLSLSVKKKTNEHAEQINEPNIITSDPKAL